VQFPKRNVSLEQPAFSSLPVQMPRLHLPATKTRTFKLQVEGGVYAKSAGKADVVLLAVFACVPAQT
jgi:hypothetical protein